MEHVNITTVMHSGDATKYGKHPLVKVVKNPMVPPTSSWAKPGTKKQKGQCSQATGGLDHGNEVVICP